MSIYHIYTHSNSNNHWFQKNPIYLILDGTSVSYSLTEKITNSIFITKPKKKFWCLLINITKMEAFCNFNLMFVYDNICVKCLTQIIFLS